jgi:hypothetical protein
VAAGPRMRGPSLWRSAEQSGLNDAATADPQTPEEESSTVEVGGSCVGGGWTLQRQARCRPVPPPEFHSL